MSSMFPARRYNREQALQRIWLSLISLLAFGCYSMSTLQEPETLEPGRVRVTPQLRIAQEKLEGDVRPAAEVSLRIGLVKRLELQLGVGTSLLGRLGLKLFVLDTQALSLSVVPTYQIQRVAEDDDNVLDEEFVQEYRVQTLIVPLIVGVPIDERVDLLLGGDVHVGRRRGQFYTRDVDPGPVLAFGGHVGFAVHARGEALTLVPQCGVLASALSDPARTGETLRRGSVRWECAFGMSFGAEYASRKARPQQ